MRKPLRLWPGVIAAVLLAIAGLGVPILFPDVQILGVLVALLFGLVILLWWLFFSRAPWPERIGVIVLMAAALAAISRFVHPSISNGLMGRMLPIFGTPMICLALVVAVAASRRRSTGARRAAIVVAILLASAAMTLVRTSGVTGEGNAQLHWRWTPTPEERLLAQVASESPGPPPAPSVAQPADPASGSKSADAHAESASTSTPAAPPASTPPASTTKAESISTSDPKANGYEWSGFRGPDRNSVVHAVHIETDWTTSPPIEMWRRPIGPGWSSFAVHGDLIYTQEQRGEEEIVSAHRVSTGEPVWMHRDPARFYESNGGPGPRATPTVHGGRVYTLGATGIVNVLDARSGARVWSRNAQSDTGATRPGWGFAGSPLVVGDALIVAASGRLVAYDLEAGTPRWTRTTGGGGYSSPHLATIDGVLQILLLNGGGVTSVAPADGRVLWDSRSGEGVSIVQPVVLANQDVLVAAGDMMGGTGIRRISVSNRAEQWTVEERWTTRGLKPYFNDFVVHDGQAFGFDGTILACIDIETGERKWKGGRYGAGQMLLLADQDLLLVLSEEGELALVSATPEKYMELARFKAIEGKTWNHPVLVGDVLLVRNGEVMAAFRLPRADR